MFRKGANARSTKANEKMGVWGIGLYSGDFALDLRSTIAAVARLPFDGEKILEILRANDQAANDPKDPDHTTFWFVLADQFQKRGIPCREATARALALIDSGADGAMLQVLGMKQPDLRKRESRIAELRVRLAAGTAARPRSTLKKPERFVMDVGDVYIYPTSCGHPINPYFRDKSADRNWVHDGWSAIVILERGLAFEYLAWYSMLVAYEAYDAKPTLESLKERSGWILPLPGTCSPLHIKRMELARIGRIEIDPQAAVHLHPSQRSATSAAVLDISICNHMRSLSRKSPTARLFEIHTAKLPHVERLRDLAVKR